MTDIAIKPFLVQDCVLHIGADNYEASASSIELVPSPVTAQFKGLKAGNVINLAGVAPWVCKLTYAQDLETTKSLAQYLFDHEGETIVFIVAPRATVGKQFTFSALIVPGTFGGAVDAVAASTVSLPVNGKPTYVP